MNRPMDDKMIQKLIGRYLSEDIGDGDHSSLACIPSDATGKAKLLVKQEGIVAGLKVASILFNTVDDDLKIEFSASDGEKINPGQEIFLVTGSIQSILKSERLALNILQRMSGIATSTHQYTQKLEGLKTKILDTRKTTPGFRIFEKEAVRIGGGTNHRMGLYDMIMLKDNHIDYSGGIENAINRSRKYLSENNLDLKIEIEARNINDVRRIVSYGGIDRIMLDNFSVSETSAAVNIIAGRFEIESSGGITLETIRSYAECGVDYISVGALTHHIKSLDMSLKATK
ncbi:MAG TPA: carboxylating nicotinate-nucleotide diphosphorylase [Bacteroidales bacterium]|nr:carboxylating nicotinate-nucleotide diphosphorylase [Bacteroidales bacterium]